jgi:hypothetical protein
VSTFLLSSVCVTVISTLSASCVCKGALLEVLLEAPAAAVGVEGPTLRVSGPVGALFKPSVPVGEEVRPFGGRSGEADTLGCC